MSYLDKKISRKNAITVNKRFLPPPMGILRGVKIMWHSKINKKSQNKRIVSVFIY